MKIKIKNILGKVKKACDEFCLIDDDDKIAVGISGGKDSLTLLTCLAMLRHFYPKNFELGAIAVDIFGGKTDYTAVQNYCKKIDVPFVVVTSNIKKIVFDIKKEPHPCSLCANLRRGFLNSKAKQMGFNKVALGHHADDLIETFFMCMIHESRLSALQPKTKLTDNPLEVIRPMILCFEDDILDVSKEMPVIKNLCPADKHTERERTKQLIQNITNRSPNAKKNILSAILHRERYNLLDKYFDNVSQNIKK